MKVKIKNIQDLFTWCVSNQVKILIAPDENLTIRIHLANKHENGSRIIFTNDVINQPEILQHLLTELVNEII